MVVFEDVYVLSVVLFLGLLAVLVWRDRKNIEFHPFLIMRRTKRFRDAIDRVASSAPRFWCGVGTVGMILAPIMMLGGLVQMIGIANTIMSGLVKQPALAIALPNLGNTVVTGPGFILLPFWVWIIVISAILIPHELMHGIIARAEKIRLRSVGLLLLLIIPGAFVEPDEKQLKMAKLMTRLKVFAAGSFANYLTAFFVLYLILAVIWPTTAVPTINLNITAVNSSGPFAAAGITSGMLITAINDGPIKTSYWEYVGFKSNIIYYEPIGSNNYVYDELGKLEIGKPVTFTADGKDYIIAPIANPNTGKPWFGFYGSFNDIAIHSETVAFLLWVLTFLWMFSSGVAIVNILPIKPLDGGLFFEAVAKKYCPKRSKLLTKVVTYSVFALILFGFIGAWLIQYTIIFVCAFLFILLLIIWMKRRK